MRSERRVEAPKGVGSIPTRPTTGIMGTGTSFISLSGKNYRAGQCVSRIRTIHIWCQRIADVPSWQRKIYIQAPEVMRYVAPGLYPAIAGSTPARRTN